MISFSLLRVPVHIHLSFWAAAVAWGFAFTAGEVHPVGALFFALALFLCLLLHEWGHAVAGRLLLKESFGICLSWQGGACCCEKEPSCNRREGVLIALAGPLLGLLGALLVSVVIGIASQSLSAGGDMLWHMLRGEPPMAFAGSCPPLLLLFAVYLLQISVVWTALNLLPIFPLDGGLMMHELMGETHAAHTISLIATCLLSLCFIAVGIWALAGLMLYLAYYNYKCILVHTE